MRDFHPFFKLPACDGCDRRTNTYICQQLHDCATVDELWAMIEEGRRSQDEYRRLSREEHRTLVRRSRDDAGLPDYDHLIDD